jgi:hypothetical protein
MLTRADQIEIRENRVLLTELGELGLLIAGVSGDDRSGCLVRFFVNSKVSVRVASEHPVGKLATQHTQYEIAIGRQVAA